MTNASALGAGIRKILLHSWDPIGVAEIPAAADEYDQYVKPIVTMIVAGAAVGELANYLLEIETHRMGLKGDERRAQSVAARLREIGRAL